MFQIFRYGVSLQLHVYNKIAENNVAWYIIVTNCFICKNWNIKYGINEAIGSLIFTKENGSTL
jgi:hypothetical protein